MSRTTILLATVASTLTVAAPSSAHYVNVDPAGGDNCVVNHVGQYPPAHHSMAGHSAAAAHEQSAVVRFGSPGTC